MKISGVSSRGEYKTIDVFEFVEVTATGGGFKFVEGIAEIGVFVGGMGKLHAARNNAARKQEDIIKISLLENSFFI